MSDVDEIDDDKKRPSLFDIAAQFELSIGGLAQQIKDAETNRIRREQRGLAAKPNYVPLVGNTVLNASGVGLIDMGSPNDGRVWTIRQLITSAVNGESFQLAPSPTSVNGTFAAAGAGSVTLPQATTLYITGFDVNISAGTAAGLSTVTLSGVVGGPLTYSVQQETASGTSLSVRFPTPGLLVNGVPTLSINATVGGGSGTLNLYGVSAGSTAGIMWYIGTKLIAPVTTQWRWTQFPLPAVEKFTSDSLQVNDNQNLFGVVSGGLSGQTIAACVIVKDEPHKSFTTVSEV